MKEFNTSLSIVTWYMTVVYKHCYFMSSYNFQKNGYFFLYCCSGTKLITGTFFPGGGRYFTINATLVIQFFPFIRIIGRSISRSSIMTIMSEFIIRCRLIMGYLLLSTIIIGCTGYYTSTPTPFWVILTRVVLLMLYKYSQKKRK